MSYKFVFKDNIEVSSRSIWSLQISTDFKPITHQMLHHFGSICRPSPTEGNKKRLGGVQSSSGDD